MENETIKHIGTVAIILLLIATSIIMMRLTKQIKTDGGKCTANPLTYSEHKIKEKSGKIAKCECNEKKLDIVNISLFNQGG